MKIILITISILSLSFLIKCDLPIHCLNSQVKGLWKFRITKPQHYSSPLQNNCGHMMPDHERSSYLAMSQTFEQQVYKEFLINLDESGTLDSSQQFSQRNNNKKLNDFISSSIKFRFKSNKSNQKHQTQNNVWTMIYDEGFEVRLDNLKILLFNQYFKQQNKWKSNCSNTIVGWYRNIQTEEYGCVKGEMIDGTHFINDQQDQLWVVQNKVEVRKAQSKYRFKETTSNFKKNNNKYHKFKYQIKMKLSNKFMDHQKIVEKLNSIQGITWKAAVSELFLTKNIGQINRMSGRMKKKSEFQSSNKQTNPKPNSINKLLHTVKDYTKEDLSMFPKELDWSQKLNYMSKLRSQEDCGSCYAISSMSMIDMRLRIKYPQLDMDSLSVQQVLDCNYYNQGCDGGYPSLVGKYGNELFFIEEKYKYYKGQGTQCNNYDLPIEDMKYVVKVKDYGYIGGRYGAGNTSNIMREIMENGPVVLSFEPDYFFSLYSQGVYQKVDAAEWIKQGIARPEWIKIDHSVLCYGWGETFDGVKYWLLQNSWGDRWGDKGTFKMLRGKDEMGIESSGEFATVYLDEATKYLNTFKYISGLSQ